MTEFPRPLSGLVVGVSVSRSDDGKDVGFPEAQVNHSTVRLVTAFCGQGLGIVFGHDWRDDGVMEAVYGFARQMQPLASLAERRPVMQNILPWPDEPVLPREDREQLASTLRVEAAGLPAHLQEAGRDVQTAAPRSPLYRYLRARGLTFLRKRLNSLSNARLCLGGATVKYAGRYPGVIEEAFLAVEQEKPLFISCLLGGASQQIADAILGSSMHDDFCRPTGIEQLYSDPSLRELESANAVDLSVDRELVWNTFAKVGLSGIARANHLDEDENYELFETRSLDRVVELVLTGLSRQQNAS